MKRVSFIAMIALALVASPRAIAQQAQGSQGQQALCRDAEGKGYSQGAMTRGTDGGLLRCASGRWEPVPAGPATATTQSGQGSAQGSGQGSGQGQGRTTTSSNPLGPMAAAENVKLELVVGDQTGASQPIRKVMTLLLAERATGRVRSGGEVFRAGTEQAPGSQYIPVTLNADVNVTAISGDRIRVGITVEYMPAITGPESAHRRTQLNQTVDVVLTNGKPTLIVESADPTSDRKVSLTATATIVR